MGLLFSFISYSRFIIILVWLGIAALGGLRASTFFNNLEDNLNPPYHSRSAEASRVFYGHVRLAPRLFGCVRVCLLSLPSSLAVCVCLSLSLSICRRIRHRSVPSFVLVHSFL